MPPASRLNVAYRAVLLAFGLLVAGLLFRQLATLMIAILMTVLIAIPLSAAATRLEQLHVPRHLGALLALLTGVGALVGLLVLLIPELADETRKFVDDVPSIADSLEANVRNLIGAEPGEVGQKVQDFLRTYGENPGKLIGPVASVGESVAALLAILVVILLTAFYMAANPEPLVDGLLSLLPSDRREWARSVLDRLRSAWIGWMQGVAIDMLITGVLLYVGLTLIGLEFALVFSVFSALLVVIPYFGAIAAGVPVVLFALTDSPGKALLALSIYVLAHQIEGNVTMPLIMAQRVKLHPAVVAIGVILVGRVFGIVGLFVAVPILALVTILTDELWVKPLEDRRGIHPATESEALAEAHLPLPERGSASDGGTRPPPH